MVKLMGKYNDMITSMSYNCDIYYINKKKEGLSSIYVLKEILLSILLYTNKSNK